MTLQGRSHITKLCEYAGRKKPEKSIL